MQYLLLIYIAVYNYICTYWSCIHTHTTKFYYLIISIAVSDEVSDDTDENGKSISSTLISTKSSSTLGSSLRRRSVDIKPLSKIDEIGATDKKIPPLAMHPCHPAFG